MSDDAPLEDRYELLDELGRGAFGVVLRARRKEDGAPAAVKLTHEAPAPAEAARLAREVRLFAALRHPRLASLLDAPRARDGRQALVYELVLGKALDRVLEDGRPSPDRARRWLADLAEALDALHSAGLVHRDVKPANVMVQPSGRLKLLDFGLARSEVAGQTLTRTGTLLGTPQYMAPEMMLGSRAGPAADLYALGCVAFELLTGRVPFPGGPAECLDAHLNAPVPAASKERPGIPAGVDPVLRQAMAKAPEARFSSAAALVQALEAAFEGGPEPEALATALGGAEDPGAWGKVVADLRAAPPEPAPDHTRALEEGVADGPPASAGRPQASGATSEVRSTRGGSGSREATTVGPPTSAREPTAVPGASAARAARAASADSQAPAVQEASAARQASAARPQGPPPTGVVVAGLLALVALGALWPGGEPGPRPGAAPPPEIAPTDPLGPGFLALAEEDLAHAARACVDPTGEVSAPSGDGGCPGELVPLASVAHTAWGAYAQQRPSLRRWAEQVATVEAYRALPAARRAQARELGERWRDLELPDAFRPLRVEPGEPFRVPDLVSTRDLFVDLDHEVPEVVEGWAATMLDGLRRAGRAQNQWYEQARDELTARVYGLHRFQDADEVLSAYTKDPKARWEDLAFLLHEAGLAFRQAYEAARQLQGAEAEWAALVVAAHDSSLQVVCLSPWATLPGEQLFPGADQDPRAALVAAAWGRRIRDVRRALVSLPSERALLVQIPGWLALARRGVTEASGFWARKRYGRAALLDVEVLEDALVANRKQGLVELFQRTRDRLRAWTDEALAGGGPLLPLDRFMILVDALERSMDAEALVEGEEDSDRDPEMVLTRDRFDRIVAAARSLRAGLERVPGGPLEQLAEAEARRGGG